MENPSNDLSGQDARFKDPRFVLVLAGMILFATIMVVSILRDKFVSDFQNQVTVSGRGKVAYVSDKALVTLGVQIDKAPTAENALQQISERMNKIILAEKALGIPADNIQTQNYSLFPQYDYRDGITSVSGYTANQQLSVKVEGILENSEILSKVIAEASKAGANQVTGIKFDISNLEQLKQQARELAIQDAKAKSKSMAKAAGIRLGKLIGWYENIIQSPDMNDYPQPYGFGAGGEMTNAKVASPQIPTGTQEIVIELNLNYEVK